VEGGVRGGDGRFLADRLVQQSVVRNVNQNIIQMVAARENSGFVDMGRERWYSRSDRCDHQKDLRNDAFCGGISRLPNPSPPLAGTNTHTFMPIPLRGSPSSSPSTMSRLAPLKSSPASKRSGVGGSGGGAGGHDGELHSHLRGKNLTDLSRDRAAEICPVCKSSRYLNATLVFKMNPECYHTICQSCVDRIFSHGPAQCPIPSCGKTLRKQRFRVPTFEDLHVEREIDIRQKVAAVFNKREDEFESLRAWNDYLNEVEDITFNLVHSIEVEETNRRFDEYRSAHEQDIRENALLAEEERKSFSAAQKRERQQARERREAARREEEDERRETEENRKDVLKRLASGQDAEVVARQGQQVQLKKRLDRQAATERQRQLHAADSRSCLGVPIIKGLKPKSKPSEPEAPIDAFGGIRFVNKYFTLQDEYVWDGIQEANCAVNVVAGGFDIVDYTKRSLCAAFSGLGVFLADDTTDNSETSLDAEIIAPESDKGFEDSTMTDVA